MKAVKSVTVIHSEFQRHQLKYSLSKYFFIFLTFEESYGLLFHE